MTETTKPNLADQLPEPPDGTNLVIRDSNGEWHLICRNDQDAAESLDEPGDERWFSSEWSYPEYETWASILTYAVAVYRVDAKPLAELPA